MTDNRVTLTSPIMEQDEKRSIGSRIKPAPLIRYNSPLVQQPNKFNQSECSLVTMWLYHGDDCITGTRICDVYVIVDMVICGELWIETSSTTVNWAEAGGWIFIRRCQDDQTIIDRSLLIPIICWFRLKSKQHFLSQSLQQIGTEHEFCDFLRSPDNPFING